jgi:hypothetical protein
MTNQTLDVKNYHLNYLNNLESLNVNGGATDMAYDIGTLCRYSYYCMTNNFGGQVMTICQWARQNGYVK